MSYQKQPINPYFFDVRLSTPAQRVLIFCVLMVVGLVCTNVAVAITNPRADVAGMFDQFKALTLQVGQSLQITGATLLFMLAAIQFTWNSVDVLIKGNAQMNSVFANLIRTSITSGIFYGFIMKSGTWLPYFVDQFLQLGGKVSGVKDLTPGGLLWQGVVMINTLGKVVADRAAESSSFTEIANTVLVAIQVDFFYLLTLITFAILAGQLSMVLFKAYLWYAIAPLLMGFGGLKATREIAINTLRNGIPIGVTLMVIYIIASLVDLAMPIWGKYIMTLTMDDFSPLWASMGVELLIAFAAWQAPKIASDFINGTISGGLSEPLGAAIAGAAGGAAAAAGVGAAWGAARDAGSKALDSVAGALQAGQAGMNSARDMGLSGGSAVAHAAGEVAGAGMGVAKDFGKEIAAKMSSPLEGRGADTIGAKIAERIEAGRGGMISPATGEGVSAAGGSAPLPAGGGNTAPGSDVGTGGASGESATQALGSESGSSQSAPLGDAAGASIGAPVENSSGGAAVPAGVPFGGGAAQEAQQPGPNQQGDQPLHRRIQNLSGFVPPGGDATVSHGLGGGSMTDHE